MKSSVKTRETNIELLRILSMVMIISLHYFGHGGIISSVKFNSVNYYTANFFEGISFVSVNCYVLISGYFIIHSEFKIKKLLILLGEVFFYSVLIYFILLYSGLIKFSWSGLLCFMPVLTKGYWFVTVYVGMYIISPLLNKAIKTLNRKQHLTVIVVASILFCVWPNIFTSSDTFAFGGGVGVVWFIVLYFVAAYFRLYYQPSYKTGKYLFLYLFFAILVPLGRFAFKWLNLITHWNIFLYQSEIVYQYNSILVFPASVALFVLFLNIKINSNLLNKIILFFSPLTFGVYLIHDNSNLRSILWKYIDAPSHLSSVYFPVFALITILGIFIICSLIEKVRLILFKNINQSIWLDRIGLKITDAIEKFIIRFTNMDNNHISKQD